MGIKDNKYGAKFPLLRDMAAHGTCDPEIRAELIQALSDHDQMLSLGSTLYDDTDTERRGLEMACEEITHSLAHYQQLFKELRRADL